MTQPTANCPNCGAKIIFRWSSSVQTVCQYCKSILVRTDIDLKKVGQVADLPPNSSPIQLATEGIYNRQAFTAVGRIIYEYDLGTWNEWHLVLNNGSAWLSDAQDDYVVTFAAPGRKLPTECRVGKRYTWDNETYTVTTITKAHYRGVEGELPFQYWDKQEVVFVDLMSASGKFATVDYSDEAPALYLGESVDFDSLKLKKLAKFRRVVMSGSGPNPPGTPQVKSLNCPGCGAAITLRSFTQAVTVVCDHCHSILDARDPRLTILQKFIAAVGEDPPLIPLGTRGTIRGTVYEAIGFQRRTIHVEGLPYSWHEYVLFNPYKGFRYLTEYNGHWNDTSILRSLPTLNDNVTPATVTYLGETYKHFQTAQAGISFVLGEFPWQVRVGESSNVSDYISPPRVISSERTGKEITWSMGEYISGRDIWKAFALPGDPPERVGVYENQPSPLSADTFAIWFACAGFIALLVLMLMFFSSFSRNEQVIAGNYEFDTNARGEASFVTDGFELKGHTSDLELKTTSNVDNNWIYLNCALINQDTGHAYDFGREVSYYHGYDSDGSWSEGKQEDSVAIPSVPPGNYYLRVEPESDFGRGTIWYSITATRDVPQMSFFGLGLLALLVPAALITWRSLNFEHLRWAESDYAPTTSSDDSDQDDNDPDRPITLGNISDKRYDS